MSEGQHLLKERAALEADVAQLVSKIQRIWGLICNLPVSESNDALRERISDILELGDLNDVEFEHQPILDIEIRLKDVELGSGRQIPEEVIDKYKPKEMPLEEWAARMEKTFNAMTVETKEGLRKLAAREAHE